MNDIIELISGQDQPPSGYNGQNKGIPYITGASNIVNEEILINRWTETPKSIAQNGDLLITCKGTVGAMAIVDCGNIHIARQIMAIRNIFNLNIDYIKIVISNEIDNLKKKAKSMIPGISRKDMLELIIPLPPLKEQQNISLKAKSFEPIIGKYDTYYNAKNDLDSSIYDTLKKSLLQYAIQGKLVPQDPNDEPASVLLERIRAEKEQLIKEGKIKRDKNDSYIYRGSDNSYYEKFADGKEVCIDEEIAFEIPENWCWCRLGSLVVNRDAERKPLSSEQRTNLNKKYDYYGASGIIDMVDDYIFDKRLLLIGEDGANLLTRSKPIAFFAEGHYWVNNHAHVLDSTESSNLDYLALYINAIPLHPFVTGTAQPKMNQEKMNSILVAVPPQSEQLQITQKVSLLMTIL